MKTSIYKNNKFSDLRKKAEAELKHNKNLSRKENPVEIEHELNVHKVELEMQNEELRVTQSKLEQTLEDYADLFEYVPVGYFILDMNGVIVNVNNTGSDLLGINKEALVSKPFSLFLSTAFCQDNFYRHRMEVMETEKQQQVECKINRKGRAPFPALIFSSLIKDEQRAFKYFLLTVSDITERKEQERNVKYALAKEIELNELKSRFITTASHEFRTPLAAILLSAELIEKYIGAGNEDNRKKHIGKIKAAVIGLREILTDFLTLDRYNNGIIGNNPQSLDLVEFIKKLVEEINISQHPVNYSHIGQTGNVCLDPKLLKICLTNLLVNAIKYSPQRDLIKIASELDDDGNIQISISDQGIGIPESDKAFIFDQFFRAKNAEGFQGTGVGLSLVQKFVTLMNGSVSFTSTINQGSVFVLKFPVQ